MRPLGSKLVIKRDPLPAMSGLLHIPDTAVRHTQRATVVAVGSGRTLTDGTVLAPSVTPGDRVALPMVCPGEVELGDGLSVIHDERDLFGVVEGEDRTEDASWQ
jgi:chaperonin GroES